MPNKLIHEQSPYLLQHAHNPVHWLPWGDEAFEIAKAAHRPVIVSIGYAACHWCHVMERESFEDEAVAAYMNEHFVCIKVDREEHPDVDHLYMDAVQALTGAGGWPLNVFVTPGRLPFYGGTYFPPRPAFNRPSWMQLLHRMEEIWREQQDEVAQQSEQMLLHLRQISQKVAGTAADTLKDKALCRDIADNLLRQADKEYGGFGAAPKFPGTMAINFLLEHYQLTGYGPALQHALVSLDAMIAGGIYDQLGGGFARYATDQEWLVPHFEKMLYDNALIISALCDAYLITKDLKYSQVIEESIAFAERELRDKSGGYCCAIDADSEGEEGRFYTWTWEEWADVLGADDSIAASFWGVTPAGNWEGANILHRSKSAAQVADDVPLTLEQVQEHIAAAGKKLFAARAERIRPLTDDKVLLSWNALMNIALCKAGVALSKPEYIQRAQNHMEWMRQAFYINGAWKHTWKNGQAKISAKLDDLAFLAQAMMALASAAGENKWLLAAVAVVKSVKENFQSDGPLFYYTPVHQHDIPVRKIDVYDGATPSANAFMAHSLLLAGMYMEDSSWVAQAAEMLHNMADSARRYSYSFGCWATLLQRYIYKVKTVVCAGKKALAAAGELQRQCGPLAYVLTFEKEISDVPLFQNKNFDGNLYIFVCTEEACLSPVSTVETAINLLMKA